MREYRTDIFEGVLFFERLSNLWCYTIIQLQLHNAESGLYESYR